MKNCKTKMILTDTHSHIYDQAFDQDRAEVMQRAAEAGVKRIFLPAIDSESHERVFEVCRAYPDVCFPMMGLHPTSVNDNRLWRRELEMVESYLDCPPEGVGKFYAVGEIGLDLYWSRDWFAQQSEAFRDQIGMALRHGLPIVVHTRSAWEEMTEVLAEYKGQGLRGVMHAFSGSAEDYRRIRSLGDFMFGIGGVVTYKKSGLADIVAQMEQEHILIETDCPYLTPVPLRGKRNESSYVRYVCDKVADIRGVEPEYVAEFTTENSRRMFGV